MASTGSYAGTPQNATADITTGSTNTRANGTSANLVTIVTAPATGTRVDDVKFCATGNTTAAMLFLYVGDGTAANARLWKELNITAISPTDSLQGWQAELSNLGLVLENGWKLYGSVSVSPGVTIVAVVTKMGDF